MKKLLPFLFLAAMGMGLGLAHGNDQIIAKYNFGILRGQTDLKVEASLSENRLLKVVVKSMLAQAVEFRPSIPAKTFAKTLQESSFNLLKQDIIQLSTAEIETTEHHIVCMIRVRPFMSVDDLLVARDYDGAGESFQGPLTVVDGVHGCWVNTSILPKDQHAHEKAHSLKEVLKVLALELIGG